MTPDAGLSVHSRPGVLTVTDSRLFAAGNEAKAALFARRLLRFADVQSLELDPAQATATLRYRIPPGNPQALVDRFADALTGEEMLPEGSLPPWRVGEVATLRRHAGIITTVEIVTLDDSRLEARHPAFGHEPATARRTEDSLRETSGVLHAAVASGTLHVRFTPAVISAEDLLRRIERELLAPPDPDSVPAAEPVQFGFANAFLGVGALGEFLLPAATPVGAGLLVYSNIGAVRDATGQVRAGKLGLPALYTGILAMTLLSGQVLSAALMFWCFRKWEQRYREDLEAQTQATLDLSLGATSGAWAVTADGSEKPVPRLEIHAGQRLRVRAGERVPVDAAVIDGVALVDEVSLRGNAAPVTRIRHDEVLAGSRVLAGDLSLEALRPWGQTRAAEIARTLVATAAQPPLPGAWALNPEAEAFANTTVVPTMVAAGLGLLAGGPAMAGAILRPDYATGMGLAAPLETLRAVRIALSNGTLIRSADAMSRFAASSWIVLDDHEGLLHAECDLAEMRVRGVREEQLLPALSAAGAWLGDPRGPALLRACRARRLVARRANLREIDASGVAIDYGSSVLRLRGPLDRNGLLPLQVEVDGTEVAELRFHRADRLAAAASIRRLQRAGLRVMLTSERPTAEIAPLAERLGADRYVGDMDANSRQSLLEALGERGVGAVHVQLAGSPRAPGNAHLSVVLDGADKGGSQDADIVLFGSSLSPLPELAALARDTVARIGRARRLVLAPNLACVAGAVAFGFTGLVVVVISNLGTSLVYNRARRSLDSAAGSGIWVPEAAWREEEADVDEGRVDADG